jgi:hypothetical protein
MKKEEIVKGVVKYLHSDQWQELMHMLTQTDEEIYHIHLFTQNQLSVDSIDKLLERYFKKKGLTPDRLGTPLAPNSPKNSLGVHNVHPDNPDRHVFTPLFDFYFKYNPNVILEPANPTDYGEEGKNIIGWGKSFNDKFMKQFAFKSVGPREEWEIEKFFHSAHWQKFLNACVDPAYLHVHCNVEINFNPWILKVLAVEAFNKAGYTVNYTVPCVYRPPNYLGKMIFLLGHPEAVHDICWSFNPKVVIKPVEEYIFGTPTKDGDPGFSVCPRHLLDSRKVENKYETLTDEQIEEILKQV